MNPAQSDLTLITLSPCSEKLVIFAVMVIVPILGMAVDLISPSLPAISHALKTSNTFSKNLVTIYLLGYGFGTFIMGLLSDTFGRRSLNIIGFSVFILASLLPALLPYPSILMIARLLQGLSLGSVSVVRAVLVDILPAEKLVRLAALTTTMWGIGPIIGPAIGSYLQYYISWQAGFYFFALYGLLALLMILFIIPETHFNRQPLDIAQIGRNIRTLLSLPLFTGIIFLMGLSYSSLIIFHTLGPFLIQIQMKYSTIFFGHLALEMGVMFLAGTMMCRYFLKNYRPESILRYSISFFSVTAVIFLILAYIFPLKLWCIILFSALTFLGCGLIYPACVGKSLSLFRHLAGTSSALMNLTSALTTSLLASIMGLITAKSLVPLAWLYAGLLAGSSMIYLFIIRRSLHRQQS